MIVPPFIGQEVVRSAREIADEKGYVKVRDTYQTQRYGNVYAVGIAAAVDVPWQTATPVGIPKTGFPTEQQAHVAAKNIAAQIRGDTPDDHKIFGEIPAICVMDAGPPRERWPWPTVMVARSPTPSVVRMAARSVGAVSRVAAAWDW